MADKKMAKMAEDDTANINQKVSGIASVGSDKHSTSTQALLKAIGSESEQSKLTSKIGSNVSESLTHCNKGSALDTEPINDGCIPEKCNFSSYQESKVTNSIQDVTKVASNVKNTLSKDEALSPKHTATSQEYSSTNKTQQNSQNPSEAVVPESMYDLLQQQAQNVLKMITRNEKLAPVHSSEKEIMPKQIIINDIKTSSKTSQIQSVESAKSNSSRSFTKAHKEIMETKSSNKFAEQSQTTDMKQIENKQMNEESPHKVFPPNTQNLSMEDNYKLQTDDALIRDLRQSAKSIEQFTTDYQTRNKNESLTGQNKLRKFDSTPEAIDQNYLAESMTVSENCVNVNLPFNKTAEAHPSANAVLKQLSTIIQADENKEKLSKKGEIISYFFQQRLLSKLEASGGTLDSKSFELVTATATKFAKWMEDILKEIDARKKETEKQSSNDLKGIKEDKEQDEDEFQSATSSKDSLHYKNELPAAQLADNEEKHEVVKIEEISDSELIKKFGSNLEDKSKYEVFNFVGPDLKTVEVKHLLSSDANVKVMVVKKKLSDTQSSNWVVEVGPDVTLETLTGKL